MTKRFLLSLSYVHPHENAIQDVAKEFFPGMNYDEAMLGCWFDNMKEAIAERDRLKAAGIQAAYDVYSYDDAWTEATDARNTALLASHELMAEKMEIVDDEMILGDDDKDLLDILNAKVPIPLVTGDSSITIARLGIGDLYFCRDNARIRITLEEAEALVKISPQCVHLYGPGKGAEPL